MIHECVTENHNISVLHCPCMICRTIVVIKVDTANYLDWKNGALAQNALKELSVDEREILISGICGNCFDNMFPEEME